MTRKHTFRLSQRVEMPGMHEIKATIDETSCWTFNNWFLVVFERIGRHQIDWSRIKNFRVSQNGEMGA
jgi:hypothetical protein